MDDVEGENTVSVNFEDEPIPCNVHQEIANIVNGLPKETVIKVESNRGVKDRYINLYVDKNPDKTAYPKATSKNHVRCLICDAIFY